MYFLGIQVTDKGPKLMLKYTWESVFCLSVYSAKY